MQLQYINCIEIKIKNLLYTSVRAMSLRHCFNIKNNLPSPKKIILYKFNDIFENLELIVYDYFF